MAEPGRSRQERQNLEDSLRMHETNESALQRWCKEGSKMEDVRFFYQDCESGIEQTGLAFGAMPFAPRPSGVASCPRAVSSETQRIACSSRKRPGTQCSTTAGPREQTQPYACAPTYATATIG